MANTQKVVLAGCGGMSRAWLKTATEIDGLEVVGLVDIIEDAARARRDEFKLGGATVHTELEDALKTHKPDLVFDVTIPDAHAPNAITAFKHGCHVMSEKPMAGDMDGARRALAAARAAGRQYAVMQNRRYHRGARRVHHFLGAQTLGPLTTVNIDFFIGAHFGGFRDHMAHVLLLDMAIHTFDSLRYFSGSDPVAVYCKEWNPAGSWYDRDASAVAIFELTNGIVATYRGSWCSEGLHTSWECDWRFVGQRGSATWKGGLGDGDDFQSQVLKPGEQTGFMRDFDSAPIGEMDTAGIDSGHESCIRDFVKCVRSGAQPLTHAADNIKSLAMCFGAIESAERGQRVEIAA